MKPQRTFELDMGSFRLGVSNRAAESGAEAWGLTQEDFKTQALPLISYMTLDKSFNFSKPLFPQQ